MMGKSYLKASSRWLMVMALAVAVCQLSVVEAQAQTVKVGVKGGLDVTEVKFSKDVFNTANRMGWFAGLTVKVALPVPGLGLDISGLYNQREAEVNDVYEADDAGGSVLMKDGKLKQQQIIVPLNLRYSIGLGSTANVFVFAGPQVGFNIGDTDESIFHEIGEWRLRDSNFSVNAGGGITLGHLQLTANYNVGIGKAGEVKLNDATQGVADGFKGHYNSWQIALAYFF